MTEETVAQAAAAVVNAADAEVAERVESVVEAAAERIEAAEKTAEEITRAALEGEQGRQIVAIQEGLQKCQSEIQTQAQTLATIQQTLTAIATQLAAQTPPTVIVSAMEPSGSTPPPSPPEGTVVAAETIVPADQAPAKSEAESPAAEIERRRNRWT